MDESSLRIGDAERNQARDLLHTHRAAGRLTDDEVAERLAGVESARTYGDLGLLFEDLPGGFTSAPTPTWPTLPTSPTGVSDGRRGDPPVLTEVRESEGPADDPFAENQGTHRGQIERAHPREVGKQRQARSGGGFDWSVLVPVFMGVSILTMIFRGWQAGLGLMLFTAFIVAPLVGDRDGT